MNQAKRKTTRKKSPSRTQTSPKRGFAAPFLVGTVVGTMATIFYFNLTDSDESQFGSGLKTLFESKDDPQQVATTKKSKPLETRTVPKFDFYEMLPEYERVIPEDEPLEPIARRKQKTDKGSFYMLQTGSFATYSDADRMKAKLTLNGFQPHIQTVSIEGKGKYFRVRLGPFIDMRKLAEIDNRLAKKRIKTIRLKVTGTVK